MADRDGEQIRQWLAKTESDCESVIGVEDPGEAEEDILEEPVEESGSDDDCEIAWSVKKETVAVKMEIATTYIDRHEFYIGRQ